MGTSNGTPADQLAGTWRKSSASNPSGSCVEVTALPRAPGFPPFTPHGEVSQRSSPPRTSTSPSLNGALKKLHGDSSAYA